MKTIEKKFYVCEICGKSSQDQKKIEDCQRAHSVIGQGSSVTPSYFKGSPFPYAIDVAFSNGSMAVYKFSHVKTKPRKAEEEE